jgi:Zn-dependent protease/predicted transcriptional regulator
MKQRHTPRGPVSLFRLFGFEVRLDLSWLLLGLLITWSLAEGLFPWSYPGLPTSTYWLMGVTGAVGVFFSIVFHELSHSLVARRYGLPIQSITLFIFGGVAEMHHEATEPKTEFLMAVAGPIASIVLGSISLGLFMLTRKLGWPMALEGIFYHLGFFNLIVAVFNLIPAFPLDGGRMLRAGLWAWLQNLKRATRIASLIGSGFAFVLVALGIMAFISGNFIGGMWWVLIGMFLHSAARGSYQQILIRDAIQGQPIRKFMHSPPVTVTQDISLEKLVEEMVYKYHFKFYPVIDAQGELIGCISLDDVKTVSRERWPDTRVTEIMQRCSDENTVSTDSDAGEILDRLLQPGHGRLMVVENGELVGILALKDLRDYLSLRLELDRD